MMKHGSARTRSVALGAVTITITPVRDGAPLTRTSPAARTGTAVVLVSAGRMRLDDLTPLDSGAAVIIPAGCDAWPLLVASGPAAATVIVLDSGDEAPTPEAPQPDSAGLGVVRANTPLLALTAALASTTMRLAHDMSWMDRHVTERLLTDALGSLLDHEGLRPPLAPDIFARACALIAQRASRSGLTAEEIAGGVNLSLRQLERTFRDRGTTISRELRHARVQQAKALLADESYAALTSDQVARHVGFSNRSSLARAMRAEGVSAPLTHRRAPSETSGQRP